MIGEYLNNMKKSKKSIIKLEPSVKEHIWGGTKLKEKYDKKSNNKIISETWELSAHKDGPSIIASGKYKGVKFNEYISIMGHEILGSKSERYTDLPILIKFIDTADDLSVQVHPDDEYALKYEKDYGKNEIWYVVDCESNSYLYCGFNKDISKDEIRQRISDGTLLEVLNKVPVFKGQNIFIKTGTVHAIGKGLLICEIQQSSNVTYRLFDYNRIDKNGEKRPLHIDKALDVIDCKKFEIDQINKDEPTTAEKSLDYQKLIECEYFSVERYSIQDHIELYGKKDSFISIVVTEGEGSIYAEGEKLDFKSTDCFLIPAGESKIEIIGKCTFLKVYL